MTGRPFLLSCRFVRLLLLAVGGVLLGHAAGYAQPRLDATRQPPSADETWIRLIVGDGQRHITLHLASDTVDTAVYELPPSPPFGNLDARLSGASVQMLSPDGTQLHIQSETAVTIRAENLDGRALRIQDLFGGATINRVLHEGDTLSVSPDVTRLLIFEATEAKQEGQG